MARERNYRRLVTGPSSLALEGPVPQEQVRNLPTKDRQPVTSHEIDNIHVDRTDRHAQETPGQTTTPEKKELPPRVEILQVSGPPCLPVSREVDREKTPELSAGKDSPGGPARDANQDRRVKIIKVTTSPEGPLFGEITLSGPTTNGAP